MMNADFFNPNKSKKDQLLEFILSRRMTSTATVDEWGLKNYHIRARRDAQEMAAKGLFRRMTDEEIESHFPCGIKQGIYVRNDFI